MNYSLHRIATTVTLALALSFAKSSCFAEGVANPPIKDMQKENRLAKEASPYLRQHAKNPVDWYPWGEEAFAKARKENKPILLSIGYSTCHWCHVMERESFENQDVAKLLNQHFVAIKLDREERPDIDKVYMTAYRAMTGDNGGWPLNVFLTPELKPFYGGTYFPPEDRAGKIGFQSALLQIHKAWVEKQQSIEESAEALRLHLLETNQSGEAEQELAEVMTLSRAAVMMKEHGDSIEGGWGRGPKFPQPSHLRFLLRAWKRDADQTLLNFAELSADRMADGGICDQLGGGFHRYAVDGKWLVPHFEKMLYDQAQLLDFYLDLYLITGKERYAEVAHQISKYVIADMQDESGGFYCAEDAQSEGKEGKFFCWTTKEMKQLLTEEEFEVAFAYFGVSEEGNFYDHSDPEALKGQNVLSLVKGRYWLQLEKDGKRKAHLESAIGKMKKARSARVRPAVDDKVLASWNGMMIGALARAARVLGEPDYADAAQRAHTFVKAEMWDGKRLAHRWYAGALDQSAQAESYLMMLQATRRLYELNLREEDLAWAIELAEVSRELFYDEEHGGFYESAAVDDVMVRLKGDYDGAMPTASSVAALEYLKLADITGRKDLRRVAMETFKAHGEELIQNPTSLSCMLMALDYHYGSHQRLVVVDGEGGAQAFLHQVAKRYLPHITVMSNQGRVAEFEKSLTAQDGKATAYLCEGESCQAPVTSAKELFPEKQ